MRFLLFLCFCNISFAQSIQITGNLYFDRLDQSNLIEIYSVSKEKRTFCTKTDHLGKFSLSIELETDSLQFVINKDSTITFSTFFYGDFKEKQAFKLDLELPYHTGQKAVLYSEGEEENTDYEELHFIYDVEHCRLPRYEAIKNQTSFFYPIKEDKLWERNWYQLRAKQEDQWVHCTWYRRNNGLNFISSNHGLETPPPYEKKETSTFFVLQKQDVIYFEQSSYELGNEAKQLLHQIALRKNYSEINLIGYTDQVGEKRANDALGFYRAKAVKSFLENAGLIHTPIHILEKEDTLRNAEQKELYRKVEILYINKKIAQNKTSTLIHVKNEASAAPLILEEEANSSVIFKEIQLATGTLDILTSNTFRMVLRKKKKQAEFEYYTIWVHPGEELYINNSVSEVFFHSSDSSITRKNELNFFKAFSAFDDNFEGLFCYLPVYNNEGKDFLSVLEEIEDNRKEFASTFFLRNPVSQSFEEQVFRAFRLKTITNLLHYKRQFKSSEKVDSTATLAVINSLHENTELENFIYYLEALYLKTKLTYLDSLSEEAGFQHLVYNFSDPTRENFLFQYIYQSYGSANIAAYCKEYFKMYPNSELSGILQIEYADYLEEYKGESTSIGKPNTLFNLASQEHVTWEEILKDGKWKVIDFWATWCGGCRSDFPISKEVYGSLNLPVYYVALDHNKAAWAKISEKEGLPKEKSFFLESYRDTPIYKKYSLNAIPRYFLVNGEGKIVEDNLMRPQVSELVQQIKSYMK